MKNKLSDLNNHLFAQLERLGDEDLDLEGIEKEAKRADALVNVADHIIRNAEIVLKGAALIATHGDRFGTMLPMIESKAPYQDGSS